MSFTTASKKLKYLAVNLTKEVRFVHLKLHKKQLKEIKEYTNKWRNIPCSWIGRINVKIPVLLNIVCRFNATPIKISASHFIHIDTLVLKFM